MADKMPRIRVRGERELIAKLKQLGDKKAMRRCFRKGITAAGQVLVRSVRSEWPTSSGLSKKAVSKKVIKTRSGYHAIVGVDKAAKDELHTPSNIDHLVEFGFAHVGGEQVPAVAPLRKGFDKGIAAAHAKLQTKTAEAIEKEWQKRAAAAAAAGGKK